MKIVVIGGTGLIGKKLVPILQKRGHEAVVASRSSGVDVRSALTQAATGRIPGALAIDMKKIEDSFKGVPIDGEVILYCACPNEATAVKIARQLKKVGYTRIRPLLGGIDAWIEAGLEVER